MPREVLVPCLPQNADELAFAVGHEASHHILNHIDQRTGAATVSAPTTKQSQGRSPTRSMPEPSGR